MALGALVGAYQEDDSGALRALYPLAGRTLVEYQVRCAAAAGAAPIVLVVDRIPPALNEALERLHREGLSVTTVSDGNEAASRFGSGEMILMIGDGIAPPAELLATIAQDAEPVIVTVPDDEEHEQFERIDGVSRWAGVALVESQTVGATAAMLGDWDLQSTLLRRTLQAGALTIPVAAEAGEPVLANSAEELNALDRQLLVSSRGSRRDWASRYALPIVEEYATEGLLNTRVKPERLLDAAVLTMLAAVFAFSTGWLWAGMALLVLSTPLDLVARRLAALRLRPLSPRSTMRRLLWPTAGLALLALGWWISRNGGGWGAFYAALVTAAFAEAARIERGNTELPGQIWLFSRRNAILGAVPFALFGAWTTAIVGLSLYAAASFFFAQYAKHRIQPS
jgi:CheY-like chemotaxis protein